MASKSKAASFCAGYASVSNPVGRQRFAVPDVSRGFERDRENLSGDWAKVGAAIARSMRSFGEK